MVKAWREVVTIPTYEVGRPDKNPMFLEKRVYQGSSGVVYPYPVIESISDVKTDKEYLAVWLENEYIKVMVLPELGGRVQMAYDKLKQRHFVYYNHVVKPALVGLVGPWISGGIEFNWPQHHRPSTFMPVDTYIESGDDGSVTVWVSEMEKMFHQKGMAGFTLRPGCAYLEIKGVLYNRTDMPQTFLWWANPAVEVNDAYQSVFPPDVNAVFDHGKRAVSSFPIATGTYYKMDYSAGVDISNYRNIKVPTSYMAVNSKYNFEGGYENDTEAGMLHVASHHVSPGKKQWTWGNGDFGRAWDRNLTDELPGAGFRPYIELMAGVYTENQPDFSWLMPYEEKHFTQYFMPYRELGVVKEASRDLILNIDPTGEGQVQFKLFATSRQHVHVCLSDAAGHVYYDYWHDLTPEQVLTATVDVKDASFDTLTLTLSKECYGRERPVLTWHAEPDEIRPIPDSAEAALLPEQIKTNEQLYLTGLHLEQYRHATWSPVDYYEEALRRDPNDVRCLNALGLWYIRKGRFALAEGYLQRAVKIIMRRNPNPYDGEPIYNLGLALKYQGKNDEAYERFWKATWNKAWADAGYFEAAKISVAQGRLDDALDELTRCLCNNAHNQKALALRAAVLRLMGRRDEALQQCREALLTDAFNYGCRYEQYLLTQDKYLLDDMVGMMHGAANNYDELALDYQAAGLDDEAHALWQLAISQQAATPMTYYYMGDYEAAEQCDPTYCFPNRPDDVVVLEAAKQHHPERARAPYYLGCLFYAARQYDLAIQNWERSAQLDPEFPTVWRNLALARFNKQGRHEEAVEMMERAFRLDTSDARVLMELDQLYRRLHRPHAERLALLARYPHLISQRDDLLLEQITLLNQTQQYERAMHLLDSHQFHPWEGGEGKVPTQYQIARVELAKHAIADKEYEKAIRLLSECLEYPRHLGEGKLYGAQENDFYYLLGLCHAARGEEEKARQCWEQATVGPQEPAAAMYYNDAKPDKIFYQGMALRRLGRNEEANGRFYRLINYGKQHIFEPQVMDYFAVSLPDLLIWEDSLDMKNRIHCLYMLALGYYGMGDTKQALRYLEDVEMLDNNHQGIGQLRSFSINIDH
ncbi:MAG: DUF5107 domain-containing protein [Bacteroidales bacterium]|nr:DUF5107 domain-containing protein [Bacteroidales bacterium]